MGAKGAGAAGAGLRLGLASREDREELRRRDDSNALVRSEVEKVPVPRDDVIDVAGDGGLNDPVVAWVVRHNGESFGWLNEDGAVSQGQGKPRRVNVRMDTSDNPWAR